jgi:hypothetical protein
MKVNLPKWTIASMVIPSVDDIWGQTMPLWYTEGLFYSPLAITLLYVYLFGRCSGQQTMYQDVVPLTLYMLVERSKEQYYKNDLNKFIEGLGEIKWT